MKAVKGPIDWDAKAKQAQRMSFAELHYALIDIQKTLPHADHLDRIDGGDRGGYYRDEASIYRAELRKRRTFTNARKD